MRKWLMPAIVATILLTVTERFGLQEDAWWMIPGFLFPVFLTLMFVRKEVSVGAVAMLVLLSGVLALILKVSV